jgi:hypothetical protein
VVIRAVFLMLAGVASGQSMDDAVRLLATKTGAHLAANEAAHVISKNSSSLSQADASKIQRDFDRAIRKRLRNPEAVDCALTISENVHGFLLISKVRDDVEMTSFRVEHVIDRPRASIAKAKIWEQDTPILDMAVIEDQMLVLDTAAVTRYDHGQRMETIPINILMPRDPRGRIEIAGESLTLQVPGSVCKGTWKPLAIKCEPGGEIVSGRNTLEVADLPAHFSRVQAGEITLLAEADGRVHVYDATRKPIAVSNEAGDIAAACGSVRFLVSGAGDRESLDSLALFELANANLLRVSDPVEFPGPITALTPTLAVARNLSTGRYEAYSLTVDCGR